MKTLLELSYQNCDVPDDSLPCEIHWKIISLSKERIRKALRKQKTEIILRTLYLFRTSGVEYTIREMIGEFNEYKGCIWRLAVLHACCSFVFSSSENRKIDIVDTINNYLPIYAIKERNNVINSMLKVNSDDLSTLIDAYLAFGKWLLK